MKSRFKELRRQYGLTQDEFRKQFNQEYGRHYSAPSISMFENDKRYPEVAALIEFADFFAVSIDYLIGREAPNPTYAYAGNKFIQRENELVRKYRTLSEAGKDIVESTLEAVCRNEHPQMDNSYEKKETS